MRFNMQNGLLENPFELHQGRKPKTEMANIVENSKISLSNWTTLNVLSTNEAASNLRGRFGERAGDRSHGEGKKDKNSFVLVSPASEKETCKAG